MTLQSFSSDGTVHGRMVELTIDPRLPEGQKVVVELRVEPSVATGEGLKQAWGSWKDMPDFDAWLAETYAARIHDSR